MSVGKGDGKSTVGNLRGWIGLWGLVTSSQEKIGEIIREIMFIAQAKSADALPQEFPALSRLVEFNADEINVIDNINRVLKKIEQSLIERDIEKVLSHRSEMNNLLKDVEMKTRRYIMLQGIDGVKIERLRSLIELLLLDVFGSIQPNYDGRENLATIIHFNTLITRVGHVSELEKKKRSLADAKKILEKLSNDIAFEFFQSRLIAVEKEVYVLK